MLNISKKWFLLFPLSFMLIACTPNAPDPLSKQNSNLTQGNVELNIKKGTTTKAQVLENFGSPNIVTRDSQDQEVWTYQRSAQVKQTSTLSGGWTVLLTGRSGGGSGFESSSRMMTLIIKFDKNNIVSDFSSRSSTF